MKQLFRLICILIFVISVIYSPNIRRAKAQQTNRPPITTLPIGDVNNDGNVDQADVVLLINMFYSGLPTEVSAVDFYTDQTFSMEDIVVLIGFIQNRVPTLPVFPCTEFNVPYEVPYQTPVISLNGLPWVALPCFSLTN